MTAYAESALGGDDEKVSDSLEGARFSQSEYAARVETEGPLRGDGTAITSFTDRSYDYGDRGAPSGLSGQIDAYFEIPLPAHLAAGKANDPYMDSTMLRELLSIDFTDIDHEVGKLRTIYREYVLRLH